MIQLSSLLPAMPHGPVRPALLASGGASSFAFALGALVAPRAGESAAEGEAETLLPGRQVLAEGGKDLPESATTADSNDNTDEQDAEDGTDIAFAWFAVAPVAQPGPAAPGLAAAAAPVDTKENASVSRPEVVPLLDHAGAERLTPEAAALQGAAEHAATDLPASPGTEPVAQAEALPIVGGDAPDIATSNTHAPGRPVAAAANGASAISGAIPARFPVAQSEPPVLQTDAPAPDHKAVIAPGEKAQGSARTVPTQLSSEQARPAQPQVMAPSPLTPFNPAVVAIAASALAAPVPLRRALTIDSAALAMLPSAPDAAQPHAVSTAADVQQGALDTRRQEWMGKMVEQIEALRDAAPVRETRLSLAPEALGKVDVAIRHEGDRVHVHFATETPAARQLIADAQPRLSELAEARGLKLGQTSFESGSAGQGPNRDSRNNPASQQRLAPRPANSDSAVGTADDERVA